MSILDRTKLCEHLGRSAAEKILDRHNIPRRGPDGNFANDRRDP